MSNAADTKNQALANEGYDRAEPAVSGVLISTVAILAILVITAIGVEFYYNAYKDRVIEKIQLEPVAQDLLDLRAKEDQQLGSYGIADKATGAVRLPVSRAMELIVSESKDGKEKYSTAPYVVKKDEPAAAATPAAAAPGTPVAK